MNKTSTSIQKITTGCIAILISVSCHAQTKSNTAAPSAKNTPASTTPSTNDKEMKLVKQTIVYNAGKVYLNWVVPSNSPDCIYVIERSTDGVEYEPLGLKEGIQSPLELLYSWVDAKPMEGIAHYRIKRVNNEGEITALSSATDITTPAPSVLIRDNSKRSAFAK